MEFINITNSQSDMDIWDQAVQRLNQNYTIACSPKLVKILEDCFKWPGTNVIIKDNNKIIGMLNYSIISSKLISLPHFSYSSFILSKGYNPQNVISKFCSEKKIKKFEIRSLEKLSNNSYTDKITSFLVLDNNVENQFDSLKSSIRRKIRKGFKNNLTVVTGHSELLDDFYAIYSINMKQLGSPHLPKYFFLQLLEKYDKKNLDIFCIYHGGKPIAASFVLSYLEVSEVCWVSSLRQFNNLYPNMILYWEMIKHSILNNQKKFFFGRSTQDSSLARFKRQWGCEELTIYFNYSHTKVFNIKKLTILSKIWQRMPVSFTKKIGPIIGKNIY